MICYRLDVGASMTSNYTYFNVPGSYLGNIANKLHLSIKVTQNQMANQRASNSASLSSADESSQLLLEIVIQEESHDLAILVELLKGQIATYLSPSVGKLEWNDADDATLIDYLQDATKETLIAGHQLNDTRVSLALRLDAKNCAPFYKCQVICYLVKLWPHEGVITRHNWQQAITTGVIRISELRLDMERIALELGNRLAASESYPPELIHLLMMHILELRLFLAGNADGLLKPFTTRSMSSADDAALDEDTLEQLESVFHYSTLK